MANILNTQTLGSSLLILTDANPLSAGGTSAPIGSFCITEDGSGMFYKYGVSDNEWTINKILPTERVVYLFQDTVYSSNLGVYNNVYNNAQDAYDAAVILSVGNTVPVTIIVGKVDNVGGITLSANWFDKISIVGLSANDSYIDFIDGHGDGADAYSIGQIGGNSVSFTNISIGSLLTYVAFTGLPYNAADININTCNVNISEINATGQNGNNGGIQIISNVGASYFGDIYYGTDNGGSSSPSAFPLTIIGNNTIENINPLLLSTLLSAFGDLGFDITLTGAKINGNLGLSFPENVNIFIENCYIEGNTLLLQSMSGLFVANQSIINISKSKINEGLYIVHNTDTISPLPIIEIFDCLISGTDLLPILGLGCVGIFFAQKILVKNCIITSTLDFGMFVDSVGELKVYNSTIEQYNQLTNTASSDCVLISDTAALSGSYMISNCHIIEGTVGVTASVPINLSSKFSTIDNGVSPDVTIVP